MAYYACKTVQYNPLGSLREENSGIGILGLFTSKACHKYISKETF